jgi:predicted AlkP superfamily pyrophosphatase or phosphodiesterase
MGNVMRKFLLAAAMAALATSAQASPVLMISVDGLRPLDVIDASRGLKVPNMRALMANGAYATGVRNVLPTVTYPDHTTLVTGVWPDVHGIHANTKFDPLGTNMGGWYWYASDIQVPTLWDEVHEAHGKVASFGWPVTVGADNIDFNIPEYWRAQNAEDAKVVSAVSTPRLPARLAKETGIPLSAILGEDPANDTARAKYAAAIIADEHPELTLIHLVASDGNQHKFGPGSPEAHDAIENIDASIGDLVAAARKADPSTVIVIVSDHGFAPIQHDVNLMVPFIEAGLVTLDPVTQKVTAWKAIPWASGGSAAIMLANPEDNATREQVARLLKKLAADPANGIAKVIDAKGIAARGGAPEADWWVDFTIGYESGRKMSGPLVTAGGIKGNHGYFPDNPEMRATFIIDGTPLKGSLGEIDMRRIAPTLAKAMGVPLPDATLKALY